MILLNFNFPTCTNVVLQNFDQSTLNLKRVSHVVFQIFCFRGGVKHVFLGLSSKLVTPHPLGTFSTVGLLVVLTLEPWKCKIYQSHPTRSSSSNHPEMLLKGLHSQYSNICTQHTTHKKRLCTL